MELEKQRAIEKAKQEKEQEEKRLLEELEKERMEKERQLYKTRQFERVKQIQKEFIASQEDFARRKMAETEALENLGN